MMKKHFPKTNVLIALKNILNSKNTSMPDVINHANSNRINSTGDLLEYYVKDAYCSESSKFKMTDDKREKYKEVFSYLGNTNNPPDFIVEHGEAVEVKKIEGIRSNGLALNSSYPKDYLHHDDVRIKEGCRTCEDEYGGWKKKDMVYAIGNVKSNHLHSLWFLYGDCYCADKSTYERIANTIKDGVSAIPDVEFGETKELGRVNKVDPLGITYLRIRGMWGIDHPSGFFRSFINSNVNKTNIYVLMKKETHDKIENKPDFQEFVNQGILEIKEVQIPNPNNPVKELDAILYTGSF